MKAVQLSSELRLLVQMVQQELLQVDSPFLLEGVNWEKFKSLVPIMECAMLLFLLIKSKAFYQISFRITIDNLLSRGQRVI